MLGVDPMAIAVVADVASVSALVERTVRSGVPPNAAQLQMAVGELLADIPEPIGSAIGKVLARIAREQGLTILLVEQNMELVLGMAQRCLFMENGAIAYETSEVQQLRTDPSPIHRYLSV